MSLSEHIDIHDGDRSEWARDQAARDIEAHREAIESFRTALRKAYHDYAATCFNIGVGDYSWERTGRMEKDEAIEGFAQRGEDWADDEAREVRDDDKLAHLREIADDGE